MTYCRNLGRLASERPPATAPTPAPTAAPAGPPTTPPVTAPAAAPVAAPDWALAAKGIPTKAATIQVAIRCFIVILPNTSCCLHSDKHMLWCSFPRGHRFFLGQACPLLFGHR